MGTSLMIEGFRSAVLTTLIGEFGFCRLTGMMTGNHCYPSPIH
jgi:hypothetical protein